MSFPIIDGHNDTLLRPFDPRRKQVFDFLERHDSGHLDLPRAQEGGMGGGFYAIFTPSPSPKGAISPKIGSKTDHYALPLPPALSQAFAFEHTQRVMASLFKLEERAAGKIKIVDSAETLSQCLSTNTHAVILAIEGAESIDEDLDALYIFHRAGLRSIGPVWSRPTIFGHGVPFAFPQSPDTGPGLTDAGKRLVKTCNQLGIVVDLAHINEKGFWDVAAITSAPLIATHTGVHAVCPSTRNLTDKQIDAIGATDGVMGINFNCAFVRPDGHRNADTPLSMIVDHIDYVVQRIGIDHVAFGSDFDGALMPNALKDAAGLPKLIAALRTRGYDDSALAKIAHKNWQRVLDTTW